MMNPWKKTHDMCLGIKLDMFSTSKSSKLLLKNYLVKRWSAINQWDKQVADPKSDTPQNIQGTIDSP